MKSKILITGGSGLVGSYLSDQLSQEGFEVVHLSRKREHAKKYDTFTWDIPNGTIEDGAFEGVRFIIHLAGAGVAEKKWTSSRKQELISSRVDSANLLFEYLRQHALSVEGFISASAIGIYGFDTGGILQTEDRKQLGDDFLATLTKKWEAAADQFEQLKIRVVKLRVGLVLSTNGGLLEKMLPIAKMGLSSSFGSGEQFMSWIHINDLSSMFIESIKNHEIKGVYNAVAPKPVTNSEFLKKLTFILKRPYFLPNTPKFFMKLIFGELSSAITGGNLVSSKKIEETGFTFHFPELDTALNDLLQQ